jgi:hypothetical protein
MVNPRAKKTNGQDIRGVQAAQRLFEIRAVLFRNWNQPFFERGSRIVRKAVHIANHLVWDQIMPQTHISTSVCGNNPGRSV